MKPPPITTILAPGERRGAKAAAGDMILFESWLRHEVPAARFEGERNVVREPRRQQHAAEQG